MKNMLLFLPFLFLGARGFAQGVFSNQTNFILEKVVQEYASQFNNIKGEPLSPVAGSSVYKSTLAIPGAISTTITQSVTEDRKVISWASVLYTGPDFNTAKTRFETLFNQIKNTIIKPIGEKPVIVNGLFMNPSAEKVFNTVQFDLLPANGPLQKINIDLMLENAGGKWQIVLSVYDKDRAENGGIVVK